MLPFRSAAERDEAPGRGAAHNPGPISALQGYLAHKKHPAPQDHHRSLGRGLLKSSNGEGSYERGTPVPGPGRFLPLCVPCQSCRGEWGYVGRWGRGGESKFLEATCDSGVHLRRSSLKREGTTFQGLFL